MSHHEGAHYENFVGGDAGGPIQDAHHNVWHQDVRNADYGALKDCRSPDTSQHLLVRAQVDENGITFNPSSGSGNGNVNGDGNACGSGNSYGNGNGDSNGDSNGNGNGDSNGYSNGNVDHHWGHHHRGHGHKWHGGDQSFSADPSEPGACDKGAPGSTGPCDVPISGGSGDGAQNGGTSDGAQTGGTNDGTQNGGTSDGTPGGGTANGGDGSNPPKAGGDSGPLTLPTASPEQDLKDALANAAGPNDKPHVVPVSNDAELKNALQNAQPGDVIQLASGTYSPISINNSGRAGAPITVEAAPGAHATIDVNHAGADYGPGYAGVLINGDYIAVRGLEVTDSHYNSNSDSTPTPNGNGIMIGSGYAQDAHQHNITVENNWVHNLPGAGISDEHGDNVAIVGNKVEYTSRLSPYGVSGIGTFELNDSDGRKGAVGVYILNNEVHDNFQVVPSTAIGANVITDGNGIILDTNQGYDKWTLVEGNNVYNNGRGIHAFNSPYVRIQGNTSLNNNKAEWGLDNVDSNDPTDQVGTNTTS